MRDTLWIIKGVKSVSIDKANKTATVVIETEEVLMDTVLESLSKAHGGRYRGTVMKQEKLKT